MTDARLPDILIYMTDQHHAGYAGYAGHPFLKTPNLDRLAAEGTVFEAAYTPCPICVPARVSFLTGQLPSQTGVFDNKGTVRGDHATLMHALGAIGYETVLCGRMHFKYANQRHGFSKRILGDITALYNRLPDKNSKPESKWLGGTKGQKGCLDALGGGNSDVLEFDRAVIRAAQDYLAQDHEKPQCVVVGTYGPHSPYVAPPEYYRYYHEKTSVPEDWRGKPNYSHPMIERHQDWYTHRASKATGRQEPIDTRIVQAARAAYAGMVQQLDDQVGLVREAWKHFLQRNNTEGYFVYLSDHGEMMGEHGLFAKTMFYEASARIPLIFEGPGIQAGKRIQTPANIMDVGITLCDLVGAKPTPAQDGKSLTDALQKGTENPEAYTISEFMEWNGNLEDPGEFYPGRMVRKGKWKLITYIGLDEHDLLFNLEADPEEMDNCLARHREKAKELKEIALRNWDIERVIEENRQSWLHIDLLTKWATQTRPPEPESERWRAPEAATAKPDFLV